MAIVTMLAGLMLASQAAPVTDAAYDQMAAGQDNAVINSIDAQGALKNGDPAPLINLGVALARQGRTDDARAMFKAVASNRMRYQMETGSGEWVDSRNLARDLIAMLDRGDFSASRVAAR